MSRKKCFEQVCRPQIPAALWALLLWCGFWLPPHLWRAHSRVVDSLYSGEVTHSSRCAPQLVHAVVQGLRVVFVLRVQLALVLSRAIQPDEKQGSPLKSNPFLSIHSFQLCRCFFYFVEKQNVFRVLFRVCRVLKNAAATVQLSQNFGPNLLFVLGRDWCPK